MYDAVVLGSGVVGLSIALELQSRGIKVAIVARDIADDSNSIGFASPWAGCNWFSFANGLSDPASEWDTITYKKLDKVARERPDLCEKVPVWDVFERKKRKEEEPWYTDVVDDYKDLTASPSSPLPGNKPYAHYFRTWILHAPKYTKYLGQKARSLGIPIIQHRISSLDEAYNLPPIGKVNLVINATGLGSRSLVGVEDEKVYPARGQTVLVKAPWVRECIFHVEGFFAPEAPPQAAYMIPRPGPEGHVVLGGHYRTNDWSTNTDLVEAERILKDCYNLCPRLAGPNGKSWKDIEVVAHNVGLRPAREGGARLELERRVIGQQGSTNLIPGGVSAGRKVGVVHAYGVGGAGFQNSLGLAENASDLAVQYLKSASSNKARL
uniref:D-amino-acid oxidase n=1 Tax=Kwoniella bestiolae CBS 10118 TaxID=1296100 RepID=A0A1B9FZ50_9TREE|nr:D-amino-acid oxidase [Kwoniella bestiolae CBS 10118]OCF24035.1 D-amino-acid oxidase [Kwoniella bestiolae CBS 10118]